MKIPNIKNTTPLYKAALFSDFAITISLIMRINERIKKKSPMMKLNSLNLLYIISFLEENNI
jgi:hypothetical protein